MAFNFNQPAGAGAPANNFTTPVAGGGFGANAFGAKPAVATSPKQKLALGLSCFNEPQSLRQTSELQYYEGSVTKNTQFQQVFFAPKPTQAAATTTGFGMSAAKPATSVSFYNQNYDSGALSGTKVSGFAELQKKAEQTQKDTEEVQKVVTAAIQRLDAALTYQKTLLKEAGNLIIGQNMLKTMFFQKFPMQNYAADTKIQTMAQEVAAVVQAIPTLNPQPLPKDVQKRLEIAGMEQETQAIELIELGK